MKRIARNARGTIVVMLALSIVFLLCFVAVATEAGRWYLLRAELSKSVDAGALAAAKNISNPYVSTTAIAKDYCVENFPAGAYGTPSTGAGAPAFGATAIGFDKVSVTGTANSPAILGQLLGVNGVTVSSAGTAQKRDVEIMMVLDRSTSMAGTPIADLKTAAKSFVSYFTATQDKDKVGLISFATSVTVDRPLGTNFVAPMTTSINAMAASGYTNTEDAIDQCDGPSGFTNQTGIVGDKRIQQFMIFFSDGNPTALRAQFMNLGTTYDGVAFLAPGATPGTCASTIQKQLASPTTENVYFNGVDPSVTGDGLALAKTTCGTNVRQGNKLVWTPYANTRWYAFDTNPIAGFAPTACSVPAGNLADWLCTQASNQALVHAQQLKDAGVVIFVIGLGSANQPFLAQLSSGPQCVYYAPTSAQLQTLFQTIAQEIKLRLVQ